MFVLKFVTFFKKVVAFLRQHWLVPVLLVWSFVMYVFLRRDTKDVQEALEISKNNYKKQIDIINKIHEEEVLRKEKNLKRYNEIIELIDEEYRRKEIALDRKKKNRVKRLIEDYSDDPQSLTKILEVMYGIEYVEIVNENTDNNSNS